MEWCSLACDKLPANCSINWLQFCRFLVILVLHLNRQIYVWILACHRHQKTCLDGFSRKAAGKAETVFAFLWPKRTKLDATPMGQKWKYKWWSTNFFLTGHLITIVGDCGIFTETSASIKFAWRLWNVILQTYVVLQKCLWMLKIFMFLFTVEFGTRFIR